LLRGAIGRRAGRTALANEGSVFCKRPNALRNWGSVSRTRARSPSGRERRLECCASRSARWNLGRASALADLPNAQGDLGNANIDRAQFVLDRSKLAIDRARPDGSDSFSDRANSSCHPAQCLIASASDHNLAETVLRVCETQSSLQSAVTRRSPDHDTNAIREGRASRSDERMQANRGAVPRPALPHSGYRI